MPERAQLGHLSLLHTNPIIFYAVDWEITNPAAALWTILEQLQEKRLHLILGASWTLENKGTMRSVGAAIEALTHRFRNVTVTVTAKNEAEVAILEAAGFRALFFSQNALVREDLFYPIPDLPKSFDAIYDAKWADFKRHQLAAKIKSLALIAFPLEQSCSSQYTQAVRPLLNHATWLTSPWVDQPPYLSTPEVNQVYNRSKVGLCLSREEGGMFASIQYLLVGLPVVTTSNLGGRDLFFDPEFVRWVEDNPFAVAHAVDELATLSLSPSLIREKTLGKMTIHRQYLLDFLHKLISQEGGQIGRWQSWPQGLRDKLIFPGTPVQDVLDSIQASPNQLH